MEEVNVTYGFDTDKICFKIYIFHMNKFIFVSKIAYIMRENNKLLNTFGHNSVKNVQAIYFIDI